MGIGYSDDQGGKRREKSDKGGKERVRCTGIGRGGDEGDEGDVGQAED